MAQAFVKQFQYNIDITPDRNSLSNMKKKPTESFREYAIKWREQAARVKPPMDNHELITVFLEAQEPDYFQNMMSTMGRLFEEAIKIGEMVENGLKTGRIMDVIGPIEPKASNGHRFILVAIDYFTKWVEAITFKAVTKKAVVDFVHSNIICRFGIPNTIITDNATNLNSHLMKEVCEQFKIMHRHSTPYRPKANGAVEAANKNIKKILRKMIQGSRQWHEKLPFALLGYRTTARTSVGATPYLLVYGTEAVIPAEVEIPSLRIIVESEIEDAEWVKTRLEQLMLIDEKRLAAVCFGQLYQQRMARAYNKKVHPKYFEILFRSNLASKAKQNCLQKWLQFSHNTKHNLEHKRH
ncbi:uncharacterized protein [Nicotiana tomentosiformis]|uniref:uncharacterized protein n=1 Tax=Nicotiana tomentosiformis TaxID=4098 RepID=UPI00388C5056